MKEGYADYVVPLRTVFNAPKGKRARRAIVAIKRFVWKHARTKNVIIKPEVNEKIFANANNIPRRIEVTLFKDKEKVIVYLKGSKQIEIDKKKISEEKKKKEKRAEKREKKEEKKEKEVEAEEQKKLEEKREKEKAMTALEHKIG